MNADLAYGENSGHDFMRFSFYEKSEPEHPCPHDGDVQVWSFAAIVKC